METITNVMQKILWMILIDGEPNKLFNLNRTNLTNSLILQLYFFSQDFAASQRGEALNSGLEMIQRCS